MSASVQSYKFLEHAFERISHVRNVIDGIKWDCVSHARNVSYCFDEICSMEEMKYDMLVNPALSSAIEDSIFKQNLLNSEQSQNLKCISLLSKYYSCIPSDLYQSFVKCKMKSYSAWIMAMKGYSSFEAIPPVFSSLLKRMRDISICISESEGVSRYDALLGMFELEVRSSDIEFVLSKLAPIVRKSIKSGIASSSAQEKKSLSVDKQKKVLEQCAEKIGFRKSELLIVEGEYKLCDWVRPCDYRVFINYESDSLRNAILSLLRIAAKAIYKSALAPNWARQPVCWMNSSTLNAVISLISDRLANSPEFDVFIKSQAKGSSFGLGRIPKSTLMRFFSIKEDEKTNLGISSEISGVVHSSIMYSLEKELLLGKLEPDSIIDAWKDGLNHYYGGSYSDKLDIKSCYGETWVNGDFGVAPLRSFASVAGAQLFSCMKEQRQSAILGVESGEFSSIFRWVRDNICVKSISSNCSSLVRELSNAPLNIDSYAMAIGLIKKDAE